MPEEIEQEKSDLEKRIEKLEEQLSAFTINMDLALICEKCGKVYTKDTEGGTLIVDFKHKNFSFVCVKCKYDNTFSFDTWKDNSLKSPLPRPRIM
jgi:hypothetical protein